MNLFFMGPIGYAMKVASNFHAEGPTWKVYRVAGYRNILAMGLNSLEL